MKANIDELNEMVAFHSRMVARTISATRMEDEGDGGWNHPGRLHCERPDWTRAMAFAAKVKAAAATTYTFQVARTCPRENLEIDRQLWLHRMATAVFHSWQTRLRESTIQPT